MTAHQLLELLGYVASVLVAVSLMMSSLLKLRLINLVGSACFAAYGFLIHAYPVAAVNGFIALINVYYLRQMLGTREYFKVLRVSPDSEYLAYFLSFHQREIRRFLPEFRHAPAPGQLALFVLRDMVPAGLLLGDFRADGVLRVRLDFVIPQYRDFKVGRCLFVEQATLFREWGIREIVSPPGTKPHAAYLRRMGFAPVDPRASTSEYRLVVAPGA